ncbi:MAG: peptidoglycan DD-metalloendopeptidase family protein [Alphaproteobacteria bacterium]
MDQGGLLVRIGLRSLLKWSVMGGMAATSVLAFAIVLLPASPPAAPSVEPDAPRLIQASYHPDSAPTHAPDDDTRRRILRVRSGDTLASLLDRAGAGRTEAHEAVEALGAVFNPRDLKPGHEITLTFDSAADGGKTLTNVALDPAPGRHVEASRDGDDGFSASDVHEPVHKKLVRGEATISTSLYEAAVSAGVPVNLLVEVVRAFSYDVDFQRDIQPGDSFEIMFERFVTDKGKTIREGEVTFAALTLSGDRRAIYHHTDADGLSDYYDGRGQSVRKALLKTPIDGARLSSGYGMRTHPILGYTRMHRGVDFAAVTGTPVFAAGDGVIDKAEFSSSFGNYLRLRHTGTYSTGYAHLNRFAKGMRAGTTVRQGQVIGYVGTTGASTGPHLHYEVLVGGDRTNPLNVKFPSGHTLAGAELKRFTVARNAADAQFGKVPLVTRVARHDTGETAASN